jgi:hypothetical protein
MDPKEYHCIIGYLKDKTYPPNVTKNDRRCVRRNAQRFQIFDDELYYVKCKEKRRKVVMHDEKKEILRICHDDPIAGHFGIEKT